MTKVTNHGEKRVRKRLGLSKASVEREFGKALLDGRKQAEFKGRFRAYLDHSSMLHKTSAIIYNQNIYWVNKSGTLITVWQVPNQYKKYL